MQKIVNISQFKHLSYYLCSVVNKILAHVIWNSFTFILFKFKKSPNISIIRVVPAHIKEKGSYTVVTVMKRDPLLSLIGVIY